MGRKNKKKQPLPWKRVNIVDDEGWTHVTTSKGNNTNKSHNSASTAKTTIHDQLVPAEIPEGLSLQKLNDQYEWHRQKWQESQAWKSIKAALQDSDLLRNAEKKGIQNCVCIALGSPSGFLRGGLVDRRSISLFQLSALTSIWELLSGSHQSTEEKRCYAQDPVFNSLDKELLRSLNIEVVEHPSAFDLVGEDTFLYAPGAERLHLLDLLPLNPALFFGGPLDKDYSISVPEAEERILTTFIERSKSTVLPDFEPNANAFWRTSLYRKSV